MLIGAISNFKGTIAVSCASNYDVIGRGCTWIWSDLIFQRVFTGTPLPIHEHLNSWTRAWPCTRAGYKGYAHVKWPRKPLIRNSEADVVSAMWHHQSAESLILFCITSYHKWHYHWFFCVDWIFTLIEQAYVHECQCTCNSITRHILEVMSLWWIVDLPKVLTPTVQKGIDFILWHIGMQETITVRKTEMQARFLFCTVNQNWTGSEVKTDFGKTVHLGNQFARKLIKGLIWATSWQP